MGDMIRCPRCATHHYRSDPCPIDDPSKANILEETQEQYVAALQRLYAVETELEFAENEIERFLENPVIAIQKNGSGLLPLNCPQYDGSISCESSSGNSICGGFCGSKEIGCDLHLIDCHYR